MNITDHRYYPVFLVSSISDCVVLWQPAKRQGRRTFSHGRSSFRQLGIHYNQSAGWRRFQYVIDWSASLDEVIFSSFALSLVWGYSRRHFIRWAWRDLPALVRRLQHQAILCSKGLAETVVGLSDRFCGQQ